ncbi:hypothetical protein NEA10_01570 [Phormidium yuhuli AB48]|uniref:Riboflavin synthase subunit alpha n=1 Tax=Phormidium yuhuli AB48 TaxID=2940671 RepID=A0ABY5ARF6_9CYAN|nr:hypothetical protein [Phormidium yuhuli]USR91448.1 hypothetical protein NEA10_01570 [Phormidium yuhuli AB48]
MLVACLVALACAVACLFLSVNTREEIVKVAAMGLAGLCALVSLYFAPWIVKLMILALPFLWERFSKLGRFDSRQI